MNARSHTVPLEVTDFQCPLTVHNLTTTQGDIFNTET